LGKDNTDVARKRVVQQVCRSGDMLNAVVFFRNISVRNWNYKRPAVPISACLLAPEGHVAIFAVNTALVASTLPLTPRTRLERMQSTIVQVFGTTRPGIEPGTTASEAHFEVVS